jgi:murein L,D-transpeptidase YcbB/YkuD
MPLGNLREIEALLVEFKAWGMTMTRTLLLRSAALAALSVGALASAQAQESPSQFLQHEYQFQHGYNAWQGRSYQPQQYAPRQTYAPPGWSSYAAYTPPDEAEPRREPVRSMPQVPMPQVHVDNPDFLNYTPDRVQMASLAKACATTTAAGTAEANPAIDSKTDAGVNAGAGADDVAQPANDFLAACSAGSAGTMRMLPKVAQALTAWYGAHPSFLWVSDGTISRRAHAAIAALSHVDRVGLDPADYRVEIPPRPDDETARRQALLRFEFALSAQVLSYVLDARRGRIDPNRISGYHDLPRKDVDLAAAMNDIANSNDIAATLTAQNPDNAQFRTLVGELARLRSEAPQAAVPIAPGTSIRPGDTSPELAHVVANLRRALPADEQKTFADALDRPGDRYEGDIVKAVRAFQKAKGLKPDGVLGKNTIAALTGKENGTAAKIEKVKLALERLRWLPRDFGKTYVFLNEPAFQVSYVSPDKAPLTMRAVVGRKNAQTYFFVDHIKDVQFNPYWNVPRSIIVNEMLPKLYRDPNWLNRRGYEVSNAKGREIASNSVNWAAFARDKASVDVRQPPGKGNALGRLKIEFPNKHAIYMHDTNEKDLFSRDMRALSHGCVRLQHPREMAAAVLGTSIDQVDKRIASGKTESERVRDIPVYLAYFTAWPDADGTVHYYDDIYDRDAHLQTAMDKTEAARKAE